MSARQLREHGIWHTQNKRERIYHSKASLIETGRRLGYGADVGFPPVAAAASGAAAGAAGRLPRIPKFPPVSDAVLKRLSLGQLHDGTTVVMNTRSDGSKHVIVPLDDQPAFIFSHMQPGMGVNRLHNQASCFRLLLCWGTIAAAGLGGGRRHHPTPVRACISSAALLPTAAHACMPSSPQLHNHVRIRLMDNPDGTPNWSEGVDGIDKKGVAVFCSMDKVAADRRPTAPDAQPEIQPIKVNRINEHWQARRNSARGAGKGAAGICVLRKWGVGKLGEGCRHPCQSTAAFQSRLRPRSLVPTDGPV